MKHLFNCRRTFLAFFGICILGATLLMGKADTSLALAGIVAAIAGANSHEAASKAKINQPK